MIDFYKALREGKGMTKTPSSIKWSEEQTAIFEHFETSRDNAIVMARAGTGKTTTIKEAFSHAPAACRDMLYAVFNKKNAIEAQAKITDPRVEVKTLHSVGFKCILRVWHGVKPDNQVEYDRVTEIIGDSAPTEVVTNIVKLVGFAKNGDIEWTAGELVDLVFERDLTCDAFELPPFGGWIAQKLADAALGVLELSKHKDPQGRISFNDMVWLPVAMKWVRPSYDLVVVDEAQDMNLPQLLMVAQLIREDGRGVVVGDNRQAIYGFRGAHSDGMEFMRTFLKARVLGLTTTYRCPKKVVSIAQEFVPDYNAAPEAPEGEVLHTTEAKLPDDVRPGDAVLSRINAALMPLCLQVLKRGVRARVEGRDIGQALIKLVHSLKARSIPDFLARLEGWREKQVKRALQRKNAEDKCAKINDQADMLATLAEGMASVNELQTRITSLFQDTGDCTGAPAVTFSTVHKAKGLEWDRVFILRSTFLRRAVTEEQNIYYVGVTRAKKSLVFVGDGR